SLGELVVTNDPHAQAYANRILGQVIRVESEGELLKHERAMTADCMLHANGAVTSIREEEPILGGDSRRRTMLLRSEELAALSTAAADLQLRKHSLATLDRLLSRLHDQLSLPGESLSQLVDQREKSRLLQQELQERMYALKNREDGGLKERIARIESESQRLRGELRRLQLDGQEARDRRIALATRLQILDEQGSFHGDRRSEAASDPLFVQERAQEKLQRLANRYSADFRRVADESARRKGEALETAARRREQVLAAVSEHQSLYHGTGNIRELVSDQEVAASYDSLEEYVRRSLRDLEESRLAEYREQADLALRAAEVAFRSEFVSQLQDQFARSRETIRELNQHLKNRPFHGEYYTFHQTPNPLLGDLYRFITESTPEEQQNVGTLFDSALAPDSPQRQAVERISRALQDEAESRLLEDYREYFIFEVKMHDAEGRLRASLSQRIKKGSGGENQAPFYVAIGAALASTYRIREAQEGTLTGGAALVLFDEAFSKLDVQNTLNCLSFLRDIHLQVVLCAPDEKYGLMSEMMDTIVNICRDGAAVEVDVEYPGVAGRELLTRDNPYRQEAAAPILSTAPALGG
ncbi:MAG TPA: SbcC/MukB-like Walker B domain-containing protein, partial [Geobacterales bacterium]|nr:SbcC/MukB-like Walker B domain-containing protein [Geobacterales bacterium]